MKPRISRTREEIVAGIPEELLSQNGTQLKETCPRCGGSGHYSYCTAYGTICFECQGKKYVGWMDLDLYVKRQQDRDRREAKRERDRVKAVEARDAREKAPDPRIAALAKAAGFEMSFKALLSENGEYKNGRSIAADLIRKWLRGRFELSEAQWELVDKLTLEIPERDREKAERVAASRYIGKVGDRIEVEGEVVFTKWFKNDWGGTLLIKIQTDDGQSVTWWASSGAAPLIPTDVGCRGLEKGDRLHLKGTVKKLETYENERQTVLTRCKVLEPATA